MKLKTIAIDRDGQKVLINEKDYDLDRDILWGEEPYRDSGGRVRRPKSEETVRAPDDPNKGNVSGEGENVAPDDSEKVSEWESLAEQLVEAGERKPHPNTKLETLREKVANL